MLLPAYIHQDFPFSHSGIVDFIHFRNKRSLRRHNDKTFKARCLSAHFYRNALRQLNEKQLCLQNRAVLSPVRQRDLYFLHSEPVKIRLFHIGHGYPGGIFDIPHKGLRAAGLSQLKLNRHRLPGRRNGVFYDEPAVVGKQAAFHLDFIFSGYSNVKGLAVLCKKGLLSVYHKRRSFHTNTRLHAHGLIGLIIYISPAARTKKSKKHKAYPGNDPWFPAPFLAFYL